MDNFLTETAEFIGAGVASLTGMDMATAKFVGVAFIVLHLLTHEVPILCLGVFGFLRIFRRKATARCCNRRA